MKKQLFLFLIPATAALLAACGDNVEEVTQVVQDRTTVVASEGDLPKCSDENEGAQAFVKDEDATRVCVGGKWKPTAPGTSAADFSCKTVELKDKSGLKIVCNGDSIGVVYNGEKGDSGKDGKDGKDGSDGEDGKDAVLPQDSLETDSERVAISLDSLVGFTQKGPFLKGSTVYLYELSDGRTLKQTNGNFTSNISQENGRYKFLARDLVSQYAMVIVDGYYRNEVTGESSNAPIRLKAITDMRKRSSVNVNILTHLEFERVYYLVTKEKYTVKQAKRKAQREILNFFAVKLDGNADAEDMDVFGSTDADAALLAISILLQGDRTESDMMALLSEMSTAMAEDSVWDDDRAKAIKTEMADWAFGQNLFNFRKNVEGWGLNDGSPVGDFERFINNFIAHVYSIDTCLTVNDPVQTVDNPLSFFNGRTLHCYEDTEYGVHPNYTTRITWVEKRTNPYLNGRIKYGQMVDWRNRRLYNTTTIALMYGYAGDEPVYSYNEIWMAEDLDFDYRVKGKTYGSRENSLGREYIWAAAMDSAGIYSAAGAGCGYKKTCSATGRVRGVCPEGWYLPSKSDWAELVEQVGEIYGDYQVAPVLKSKGGWRCDLYGADLLGLTVVPQGFYNVKCEEGDNSLPTFASFWSSTEADYNTAYHFYLDMRDSLSVSVEDGFGKGMYNSIRCMKLPNESFIL